MWDEERRSQLRADLDGLYGHLYGLSRDDLAYILDTFPIVQRKDEAEHGEYRTKRLVLEAYDRLAKTDLVPGEGPSPESLSTITEDDRRQVERRQFEEHREGVESENCATCLPQRPTDDIMPSARRRR